MKLFVLISAVCVMTAFGGVQPTPGFDPQEVVRQVRTRSDMSLSHSSGADRVPVGQINRPAERLPAGSEESFLDGGFLLDTNNALVPAPGSQNRPVLAFDGANFLVVWEDYHGGDYSDIRGARVTPQGTLLDPSGFVISQSPYDQQLPALAFDGANFFVVWQDFRRGYSFDIYGARVTPQGMLLDPAGIAISTDPNVQGRPAIGFDGANFLVVWQDNRNGAAVNDIYGARVTPQGTVLDPAGFVVSQAPFSQYDAAVAFDGTNYLVAWQDSRDNVGCHIYGARVTPAGTVLDTNGFAISRSADQEFAPAIAFDGANYLLAWTQMIGSFPPELDIYGARVTPDGAVLDLGGIVIAHAADIQSNPALGFDGANFLVAWKDSRNSPANPDIYGARVMPDGTVLDANGITIAKAADAQVMPAVGFDGENFLAVWHDSRNNPAEPDIYGARVAPDGTLLDTSSFVISLSARGQYTPNAAFDGTNFMVVWEDDRSGNNDIYGARVTPGGQVLDPDGIAICTDAGWQCTPAVAFDGEDYLVAWEDQRGGTSNHIYGARVTPGGTVRDPDGFAISPAAGRQHAPAIGFAGGNYFVVWADNRTDADYDIYGSRVTPGGTVRDPDGIAISQATSDQYCPALAFDGTNFLVVWQDYRIDGGYADVYAARVTPEGAVLDLQGFVVLQARYSQLNPAVAFDGANFLAVCEDYRHGTYSDIYGARVTPQGSVLDADGFVISGANGYQYAPVLAFDGSSFLVTWKDCRSSNNPDIFGAWVAPDGRVYSEGGVVREAGNQTDLHLVHGTGSQLFLVYQGWAGTVGGKTYNTDRIWGEMNPNTGLGLEEGQPPAIRGYRSMATVVRGVLFLPKASNREPQTAHLLDITGRRLLDLHPGANDVRSLAPGVYFIRDAENAGQTRKVLVQR